MRCLAFAILVLPGCRSNFANENDRLRAEVLDLQSQVSQLKNRNAELQAQASAAASMPASVPEDIRLNLPQVSSVSIEKLSFARDTDNDGRPDNLTIYLNPADGLGRFVQIVGSIDVSAAIVPMESDPVSVGRKRFSPAEVRDAYRSSFTGTHYTLEVPIQAPAELGEQSCLVRVEFHDGLTGRTLAAERSIALK